MVNISPSGFTASSLVMQIGTSASFLTDTEKGRHPCCSRSPMFSAGVISTNGLRAMSRSRRSFHVHQKAKNPGAATNTGKPNDHAAPAHHSQSIPLGHSISPLPSRAHETTFAAGVHPKQGEKAG